jgi:hypothetical protein
VFVGGVPVVKPFPKEVWINKPKAPDTSKPKVTKPQAGNPMEMKKQGSVAQEAIKHLAGPPEGPVHSIPPLKPIRSAQ